MYVVISYDVVDNRNRYRLARILKDYGRRVQKSVFECRVNEQNFLKLKARAEKVINLRDDSIRFYFLCARCQSNIQISGWGTVTETEETVVV